MLVSELGEEALIEKLRRLFAVTAPGVPMGIGDDAAVIDTMPGHQMVWTTDLLLEGVHFLGSWQTPRQLGRKCLAVNLSDIAAMGASPRYALLSIACSPRTDTGYLLDFCQGFCDLAVETGVAVIGGDMSSSPDGLVVSVSAGGEIPIGKALSRSGARPGDSILVTGYLGSAVGAVRQLKEAVDIQCFPILRESLAAPKPALAEARLARESGASSMTDISDGLASDLKHICQASGVGARIKRGSIPVHPELTAAAAQFNWNLDDLVLAGGEDYGLLFTIGRGDADAAMAAIRSATGTPVAVIGEITATAGISVVDEQGKCSPLAASGFDHFVKHE